MADVKVTVVVDGARTIRGTSPIVLTDLKPGMPHEVRVQKPGFSDWSVRITVEPGANLKFPLVRLLPLEPEEMPEAQAAATNSAATPPPTLNQWSKARSPSAEARSARVARRKARRSSPAAETGGEGSLRINSRPWSQIFIDGKPYGNTPQMGLSLPAGTHKVRLTNPQLGLTKNFRVTVKPGKTTTKIVFFD